MRPDGVIRHAETLAVLIEVLEAVATDVEAEQLTLNGAVEPLDLSLRLGMIRSAVDRLDVQTHQPRIKPAQSHRRREGVVAQQRVGQTILFKQAPQQFPCGQHADISGALEAEAITRV